jgi:hypothetical protein
MGLSVEEMKELRRRHNDLAELYRGGSVDQVQINHLWNRIDFLERKNGSEDYD